jgi:hypothetical protein
VATPVLELIQVPPVVPSVKVSDEPVQRDELPEITLGTNTFIVVVE